MNALVLIRTQVHANKLQSVITALETIDEATMVFAVTGPWDAVVILQGEEKSLGDVILNKIRSIDGIVKTLTLIEITTNSDTHRS